MTQQDYKDQIVWIIGASSGIGAALAQELSQRGAILAVSARSGEKLEALKNDLGPQHQAFTFDTADADATSRTAQEVQSAFRKIDRVIFLAAAYTPMQLNALDLAATRQMIDINLMGAFNLLHAVLPILKQQTTRPQLALCGSVAGYVGLPGGQPYSATKAGIINLAETLHSEHSRDIDIKLISPGFVRTPLTDKNDFKMPMMIEPEQAAKAIAEGLLKKSFEIHFPRKFTLFLKLLQLLPYGIALPLLTKIKP